MRLLIFTQKLNKDDPEFLFFYRWVEEFSKHFVSVIVVCLEEGAHNLPHNVRVFSLGKEKGYSRLRYLARFYELIFKERHNYDTVFVHMNPEYVILGGLLWKVWGKKIALWYTHRQVNLKLRLAERLSNSIMTAAKESFRINTPKLHILGHGIDTAAYASPTPSFESGLTIAHLGRITRIKHIDTILKSMRKLIDTGVSIQAINLVGAPVIQDDYKYKTELEGLAESLGLTDKIKWQGIRPGAEALKEADLTVNATPPGGLDKSVLESLAAGRPVFTSNTAFRPLFGQYSELFVFAFEDASDLSEKITRFLKASGKSDILNSLASKVRAEYDVSVLVEKINDVLSSDK